MSAAPAPAVPGGDAVAKFIEQANSLLALDAKNALAPHGIGGFARQLLTEAIRLLAAPSQPAATCPEACKSPEKCCNFGCQREPSQPVTLTDDLRQQLDVALGQVRYLLKDQAEKAAIIAALREKEQAE